MMNLFQELAGKKGEIMAVAGLRYLLMRNRPLREQFFKCLGTSVSYTLYQDVSYFGCEVEVSCMPKKDTDDHPGRLDMLVESNTAVVGIEAKLGHHISKEQIEKYLPELARRKALYHELHGHQIELHMVLLVPEWQRADAETTIAQLAKPASADSLRVLTWDKILNSLKMASDDAAMNTEDQFVLKTLESYIHYWTGKIEHFDFLWDAAYDEYRLNNLRPHEEIIKHLCQFFQTGNSRLSRTANYIGYSFSPDFTDDNTDNWDDVRWGWFGFIHRNYLKDCNCWDKPHESAFCLFTEYRPESVNTDHITLIEKNDLTSEMAGWHNNRDKYLWIFDHEILHKEDLKNPAKWRDILQPFIEPSANLRADNG